MNANNDTSNGTRRDQVHKLWLLMIKIAARGDGQFEPTPGEQAEIDLAVMRAGLKAATAGRLVDSAMRFAQIQGEIQTIGDALPEFQSLGELTKKLIDEKRKAALDFDRKLRPLEKRRQSLGGLITKAAALRQESENLQRQIAQFGNEATDGD